MSMPTSVRTWDLSEGIKIYIGVVGFEFCHSYASLQYTTDLKLSLTFSYVHSLKCSHLIFEGIRFF